MRNLYLKRERALACFAIPYHCVIGQTREEHLRWSEAQDRPALMMSRANAVRSGETICIPLNEEPSSLFVIAYQEHGALTTEELPLPAGSDDLYFVATTQYDGHRRLSLALASAAPFSEETKKMAGLADTPAAGPGQTPLEIREGPARKLAVFFPGIGYTVDKPLLHYSRRLAADRNYEIKILPYSGFPRGVKGDKEKMAECYRLALTQAEEMLSDVDMSAYDDILFIGKSIGTILAARFAAKSPARDRIRLVLYTPLEDTFVYSFREAIAFTGTNDPWVGGASGKIPALCRQRDIPCVVIPKADHSLESGDCLKDIRALVRIMEETERFIDRDVPLC